MDKIEQIKKHWSAQQPISSNKVFAAFLNNLGRGGAKAIEFVDKNVDLIKSITDLDTIIKTIRTHNAPTESKNYFFGESMKLLSGVNDVLRRKFEDTKPLCAQLGIDVSKYTPQNFYTTVSVPAKAKKEPVPVVDTPDHVEAVETPENAEKTDVPKTVKKAVSKKKEQ